MGRAERRLLPDLQLDELLAELSERLTEARRSRDALHALLDAVVSIGSDLDLETVLDRIVETARVLIDCRYAALGVIGQDGSLTEFIPRGMSAEEVAELDATSGRPRGRGVLGMLVRHPQILRLADISEHPEFHGFPPGHPPMRRFLGVPIRLRDKVFGNLYLTEKSGGQEFDAHDEVVIEALATAAGVAVENARLYEETKARQIWLDASAEVTRMLLGGTELNDALSLVVGRARSMAGAERAVLVLPDGRLVDEDGAAGSIPVTGTAVHRVLTEGEGFAADGLEDAGLGFLAQHLQPGPVLLAPVGEEGRVRAVLALGRRSGGLPFTTATCRLVSTFGDQMAIVMELAEARREAEHYGLVEDRVRIARDLHDVVIQQLYAAAMSLTATVRLIDSPEVAARVTSTVDELDETVRQIRSTIFALQPADPGSEGLRARIMELIRTVGGKFSFTTGLRLAGLLDTDVSGQLADEVTAVLREALSNAARHARASRVDVAVELTGGALVVEVTDDGIGLPADPVRSGMANLEARAVRLGGTFEAGPGRQGAGTRLRWRVPAN